MVRGRRPGWLLQILASLAILLSALAPVPAYATAARAVDPSLYFSETGFGIDDPQFAEYFLRRGQVATFGFPTSRTFRFMGLPTQFFQRRVLQLGPDGGVRSLNLLDPGLLPYTRINGSTFPPPDDRLAASAPGPSQPDYASAVVEFVRKNAPDTFNGQPVRFFTTFNASISLADAFPQGGGDPRLLPLLNLEIWGVPTSEPAQDPNNGNFIYQRFQRGIMHYDASCRCTQGLLLADYFKGLITGDNVPSDLESQARSSPFLRQHKADAPNGLSRPAALPNTDLREAFSRQPAPSVTATAVSTAPARPSTAPVGGVPPVGTMRARIKADEGLRVAIDALEAGGYLGLLNAIVQSATEVRFDDFRERTGVLHAAYTRDRDRTPTRLISVNERWRAADPKALATIIAHEGKHLQDDLARAEFHTVEGCLRSEIRAFTEQSKVWQGFYGSDGKANPQDELEAELNAWLGLYQGGAEAMEQKIRQLYTPSCIQSTRRH